MHSPPGTRYHLSATREGAAMVNWDTATYEAYQNNRERTRAKLERGPRLSPLETYEAPSPDTRQRKVSVRSFRTRLLDPDNLCVKFHLDGLRYAGVIRDDTAKDIILEVSQVKVKTKVEEQTEIVIQ